MKDDPWISQLRPEPANCNDIARAIRAKLVNGNDVLIISVHYCHLECLFVHYANETFSYHISVKYVTMRCCDPMWGRTEHFKSMCCYFN